MDRLTEAQVAAILAYLRSQSVTDEFQNAVAAVAVFIIELEAEDASTLFGVTIDPTQIIEEWIALMPGRIAGISNTTADMVAKILYDSLASNDSISVVADKLAALFDDMGLNRALMIARNETTGATNFAWWRMLQMAGVPFKRWMSMLDERVRDAHAAAHNQFQPRDEPFNVDGEDLMYPGDPGGSAKNVINCRCWILPEFAVRTWDAIRRRAFSIGVLTRMAATEDRMITAIRDQFASQRRAVMAALR